MSESESLADYRARIRRELDEAKARADALELKQEIIGLANPYLEAAIELGSTEALYDRWSLIMAEPLLYARNKLVDHYAWAIPDERALEIVGATGSVVEIGAGGGYWAALLRARGVEVHAYDPKPGKSVWNKQVWTDVKVHGTTPATLHPESTLFLCWPPYTSRIASLATRRYLRAGGKRIAYVGEHKGGCCANDAFFDLLVRELKETETHYIPMFPGMHDYLSVWEPK